MVMFYVGKMVLFSKINHFVVYMFSFALPPLLRRNLNGVGLVTSVCVCVFFLALTCTNLIVILKRT